LKVHVAGPYTNPDPAQNTRNAIAMGDALFCAGFTPFIPHLTHFWHLQIDHPYEEWLEYDNQWIPCCDAVLRMPGESSGADKEVALALSLGIPVFTSLLMLEGYRKSMEIMQEANE